jgi:hypothetical protein
MNKDERGRVSQETIEHWRRKIFISWSGKKSKEVALALKEWIPDVLNNAAPWVSAVDIKAGARWSEAVAQQLEATRFCIICLDRSNIANQWVLFEAGAAAKTLKDTFVCPYLLDLSPNDVPSGPLTQFQAKRANYQETMELMKSINDSLGEGRVHEERLQRSFQRCWPDLEKVLENLPHTKEECHPERPPEDMIAETLQVVRNLAISTQNLVEVLGRVESNIASSSSENGSERAAASDNMSDSDGHPYVPPGYG